MPDPLRHKLRYRSAVAAYAVEQYDRAARVLNVALEAIPDGSASQVLGDRIQARLKEQTTGEYDWPTLWAQSLEDSSLDVAPFAHPALSVGEVPGKHRALVATAALEPGELLFIQRPTAVGKTDRSALSLVAGANLWTETLDPPAVGQVVADLIERVADRAGERTGIEGLWAGDELGRLDSGYNGEGVDVTRLEGIATFNSFHPESLTDTAATYPSAAEDGAALNAYAPSALYLLPSYMNHSCVGNVSYSFLGDVIFARARVPIAAGAELVDSYVDGADDLDARRAKLGKHGFVCGCELCGMDLRDGAGSRAERRSLGQEVTDLTDRIHHSKDANPARHLDRIRALIAALDGTHHSTRPVLRPAVYPARRLLAQTLADDGQHEEAIAEELGALKSLGAEFEGDALGRLELVAVPRVGDANAVLSALFVAKQWEVLGEARASR